MLDIKNKPEERKAASRWLRLLSKQARAWVMLTVIVGLLSGLLLIFQMYCLAHIAYAAYIQHETTKTLAAYFIAIVALLVVRSGLKCLKEVVGFQTSARIRAELRQQLLTHINRLGPVSAGYLSSASLTSSVMEQVESLHDFFAHYLPQMSMAVLMPLAILAFVFPLNTISGFILLVCAPLIPFFMALAGMGAASLQQKYFQSLARMSEQFLDAIQGLVTLKLLGRAKKQTARVFMASDNYRVRTMRVLKVAFLSSAVLEIFSASSIALLAVYLGLGFIDEGTKTHFFWTLHHLTLQGALFILLLAPEFFLPLRELGTHYHAKAKAVGAAAEISKVFALRPVKIEGAQETFVAEHIALTFQSVSLSYRAQSVPALNQVSLAIKAGEKVAIVGASGAGKTSLFNVLLGFSAASEGKVLANGMDLKIIDERQWLSQLSCLKQNPKLFKGTIRENLRIANPQATDEALMEALALAQLDHTVKNLPQGLETAVGERHQGLSGGQVQRLALARTLLKEAPLLLLDEPTSSLDVDVEREVFRGLTTFWRDKTVLLLTHRLTHLQKMHRVMVMDQGRIVQDGPLDYLLHDKTGLFYQLYHSGAGVLV